MQYTDHYNLNLPEGTDIVNPLVQDNPNYVSIDAAMYANKLRVIGTATELTTGTVHAITRADTDIPVFRFVATSDFNTGDTYTVDGVSVTARRADGAQMKNKAYVINSTVLCILDGTILNFIGIDGVIDASDIDYDNSTSGLSANTSQGAIDEIVARSIKYLVIPSTDFSYDSGNNRWNCSKTYSLDLLPAGATVLGAICNARGGVSMGVGFGTANYAKVIVTGWNARDAVPASADTVFDCVLFYV